jgi:hypothetical protein
MFNTTRRWQRTGWHLVLALVMLLMQQAGLRHALHHVIDEEGAPTHTACLECLAHHANDAAALTPEPVSLMAPLLGHVLSHGPAPASAEARFSSGYWSRAPPVLLS